MRIDYYTHPHKSQRKRMYELAIQAGEINFTDNAHRLLIEKNLSNLLKELREHAYHEETFVHPLLMKKMPHAEKTLHHEHDELKIVLKELEDNFNYIQSLSLDYIKIQEQGLEFYRALNRFIAEYLTHINGEEYMMQNLWEIAADSELRGMITAFQIYEGIEKGKKWLNSSLPAMNEGEKILMFKTAQLLAPAEIFTTMCNLTEEILGAQDWQVIRNKL